MSDERGRVDRRAVVLGVIVSTLVAALVWIVVATTSATATAPLCYLVPVCADAVPFGPEECGACAVRARVVAYLGLLAQSGLLALVARRYATRRLSPSDGKRFAATFALTFWACSHVSYGLTFALGQVLILLIRGPV